MNNKTSSEIYFACSIRGGRNDAESYAKLVNHIKTEATVLTEIFADGKLTASGMNKANEAIWKTDTDWIKQADAVIAEVTNPSLGVGYEIAKAEEWGKPVLALFREDGDRNLSAMIAGSPETKVVTYTQLDEAYKAIDNFVRSLK
jgi:nucleoside 2-deoxyribosyltransferase